MASILDRLPHAGADVVFSGRVGAVRLRGGQQLLISADGAQQLSAVSEPPDNHLSAPDEDSPALRPSYMDAFPLSFAPSPVRSQHAEDPWPWVPGPWSTDATDWPALAVRLWPHRSESDDYVYQDPYTGGAIRVCQALRQTAAAGGRAIALSYRLRFGDFGRLPEAMYQLKKVVEGMSDAAAIFQLPFVAGDLSSDRSVNLHPRVRVMAHAVSPEGAQRTGRFPPSGPAKDAQVIVLAGRMLNDISGSLLLAAHGVAECFPPAIDLVAELRVQELVRQASADGLISSALACRRGGLLITLAQCCAAWRQGAKVAPPSSWQHLSPAALLFGEAQSRFIISVPEASMPALLDIAEPLDVPLAVIGNVGGDRLTISGLADLPLAALR